MPDGAAPVRVRRRCGVRAGGDVTRLLTAMGDGSLLFPAGRDQRMGVISVLRLLNQLSQVFTHLL